MKILVDMNLSPDWVTVLTNHGITAVHWSTVGDPRAPDDLIMDWARANGYVVFVSGALPGDRVRARLTKAKRDFAEAQAVELIDPSPERVPDRCLHGGEPCPGTPWQGLPYRRQLEEKTKQIEEALRRLGKLDGFDLHVGGSCLRSGPQAAAGRRCRRLLRCHGKREVTGVGDAVLLHLGDAVHQHRQKLRGLVQVKLKQLPLCVGRHRLRFPELIDQGRVVRHRHTHEHVADGNALHIDRRLAVKGQRDRKGLSD